MITNRSLITIVTVVLNGEKFLERTIKSVLDQTYNEIEFIVIDGGSIDGTLDIINKYSNSIDYWVSENDFGIYDAMNKGIKLANGKWINFLNAGDTFSNGNVITNIFSIEKYKNINIIYGNHIVRYDEGILKEAKIGKLSDLWKGSQFCHQATFVSLEFHKLFPFNSRLKIVADFEFFYRAWKGNANFHRYEETICIYQAGGLSDVNRIKTLMAWWSVVDKNAMLNFYYIYNIIKQFIKIILKKLIVK